jgi:hypothetical protein
VDSKYHFHYNNLFDGTDASSLVLIRGDRLAWMLDSAITPRTFQVDFDVVNPFKIGTAQSLRGADYIVAPTVDFPFTTYTGNRVIKYSVTLGNGWTDDPDVVPAPNDTVIFGELFNPDGKIFYIDDTESAISLEPPDMTADATGAGGYAKVTWQWRRDQQDVEPFSLKFVSPPNTWPKNEIDSSSSNGNPTVTLFLPPSMAVIRFTITTTARDGSEIAYNGGTLNVS